MQKLLEFIKEYKHEIIFALVIIFLILIGQASTVSAAESTEVINAQFYEEYSISELQQIKEYIYESAEIVIASLLWIVGLSAFGVGILIIMIFSMLWGRLI